MTLKARTWNEEKTTDIIVFPGKNCPTLPPVGRIRTCGLFSKDDR